MRVYVGHNQYRFFTEPDYRRLVEDYDEALAAGRQVIVFDGNAWPTNLVSRIVRALENHYGDD